LNSRPSPRSEPCLHPYSSDGSSELLMLSWSNGTQTATAETNYQVVTSATPHVLTRADRTSTVTVALGDVIEAQLGTGLN